MCFLALRWNAASGNGEILKRELKEELPPRRARLKAETISFPAMGKGAAALKPARAEGRGTAAFGVGIVSEPSG